MWPLRRGIISGRGALDATAVAGFDPLSLFSGGAAGLWLDPSDSTKVWQNSALSTPAVSGDPLGGITDKSGNGNNATQATSGSRPTLTDASGKWYFLTDDSDDFLRATFTINQPYYLMAAVRIITMGLNDQLFGGVTGNVGAIYNDSGTLRLFSGNTGPQLAFSTATNYSLTAYFNGASSYIRLNGSSSSTGNPGTTGPGGVTIAASNGGTTPVGVRFYGVIMTTKALSGTEITDAEAYLAAKM